MLAKQIRVAEPQMGEHEESYVLDCLRSNQLTSGPYVQKFEQAFADYLGIKHAIACMNGTAALHLALLALGLRRGDEVILPTLTYVATANAVAYCGATPVLVDVEPDTWCMNPIEVVKKITPRTRGIIPVHLYGHPANMEMLSSLVKQYRLWMVEDAAESIGGRYDGVTTGLFGNASAFSFYGNKTITTGEGGMVVAHTDSMAERLRLFRGQGVDISVHRYYHKVIGYNYRMTNIQAALGCAQMESLNDKLRRRKEIAYQYRLRFMEVRDTGVEVQAHRPNVEHANWMFSILLPARVHRNRFMQKMDDKGIETRPVFQCMHRLPMYKTDGAFFTSEMISDRGVNLPTHPSMTSNDVDYIVDTVLRSML